MTLQGILFVGRLQGQSRRECCVGNWCLPCFCLQVFFSFFVFNFSFCILSYWAKAVARLV